MSTSTRKNLIVCLFATPLILIVLFFLIMFPYALYTNVVSLIDGFTASREWSGEPGTVTILREKRIGSSRGSSKICLGEFMPDNGGPIKEVVVNSPGPCEKGEKLLARFVEGQTTILSGFDQDTAWVAGSNDWIGFILMTVLFGVLTLITTLPIFIGPIFILIKKRRSGLPHRFSKPK
jgi:hypothetical protein